MRAIIPGKFQIEAELVPFPSWLGIWDRKQALKRIMFSL
jgi:hypothetical protein